MNEQYDTTVGDVSSSLNKYVAEIAALRSKVNGLLLQNQSLSETVKSVTHENEQLHEEVQDLLQQQMRKAENLDMGTGANENALRNIKAQLSLALKEKEIAVEMNKQTMALMDGIRQEHATQESNKHVRGRLLDETKMRNDQLQQFNQQMQVMINELEQENVMLSTTASKQLKQIASLQSDLNNLKQDLAECSKREAEYKKNITASNAKLRNLEESKSDLERDHKACFLQNKELHTSLVAAEGKLSVALEAATDSQSQVDSIKLKLVAMERLNVAIEGKEMEYLQQIRRSAQLLDDAILERDSALLKERQLQDELEKASVATETLLQEVADRVKVEVDKTRAQYSERIRKRTEEIETLEMECANLRSEVERAKRVKRAAEGEAEAMSRLHGNAWDTNKVEELQRRTIMAERARDDCLISIEKLEERLKQVNMERDDERMGMLASNQNLEQRLKRIEREREEEQHERLHLLESLNHSKREKQKLEESCRSAQLATMKEFAASKNTLEKEKKKLETKMKCLEESNSQNVRMLRKMIADHQRVAARWKEQSRSESDKHREEMVRLRSELRRSRMQTGELDKSVVEEENRKLRSQLHQARYQLLSATQKLGEDQSLRNTLSLTHLK